MMLGRRQAWPAVAIMGVAILALAVALKGGQADMLLEPPWLMGAVAGLYLLLALGLGGVSWRWPVLFLAMIAAHLFMALLMGWGYSAVEGESRTLYQAAGHGLWDYAPGTALQIGFAGVLGSVLAALLQPQAQWSASVPGLGPAPPALPDLSGAADVQAAVDLACEAEGVAGALLSGEAVVGGGIWQRDPEGALARVRAVSSKAGSGLSSFHFDQAGLIVRSEEERTAALLVGGEVKNEAAHDLLKGLWGVGERLAARAPATEAPKS